MAVGRPRPAHFRYRLVLVALTVPPLEIVPFAGSVSWAAIAAFGLSVIARDGALALVALCFAIAAAFVLGWTVF